MTRQLCFILLFFSAGVCLAQKAVVAFHPCYGSSPLLEKSFKPESGDSIRFETFRFYISGIELFNDAKLIWKEPNSFHLVDASDPKTLRLSLNTAPGSFTKIKFNLGIDSATNVAGVMGGDLDPTKGMYWAWQSGYINLKLEGKSKVCKTRHNEFQFHLGGYLAPFPAMRTITLEVTGKTQTDILVDVSKFISQIKLAEQNEVMSPGKDAVLLSEKAVKMFSVKP